MRSLSTPSEYWAKDSADKCVRYLMDYQYQWGDYQSGNTMQTTWLRNYLAYYLPALHPSQIDTSLIPEGVQGELLRMYTPEMRVAIRTLVAIITKQRLAFSCAAMVSGNEVMQDLKIGNALLDQIVQAERLDLKFPQALEGALVCGNWFMKTIWSTERGTPTGYRDERGRIITSGGVEISPVSIFDAFYDPEYANPDDRLWMMIRVTRNRWDLIAEHPDLEDKIKCLPSTNERTNYNFFLGNRSFNRDNIDVYEFYYRPCPALPNGRMVIFSDPDTIYVDDKNKYECIPVEEINPERMLCTGMGYPKMSDLTAVQEMMDNCISAAATNSASFAVQNVLIPRGANINVDEINGMNFISFTPQDTQGGGKPEALNLSATAPETFKLIEYLSGRIDKLSLLSGVLTGNPPPGVTSGTALATLAASSIEALAPINLAYYYCAEKTMGHSLNATQKFAEMDQSLEVQGKNQQRTMKKYNKDNLQHLTGVKITNVNPLMALISGRIEIATQLMGMPREQWADYCSVLEGQPLQNLYRGDVSKKDCIEMENENMHNGMIVPVLATDDHAKHIQSHVSELSDPGVRMNSGNLKVFMDHILDHYMKSQQTAPDLMYMAQTGMTPPPAPMPAGGMPPAAPAQGGENPMEAGLNPVMDGAASGTDTGEIAEPAEDALARGEV